MRKLMIGMSVCLLGGLGWAAGIALIDNRRVDVVTQGEFLAAGTALRVTAARGSRIVVQENPGVTTIACP